MQRRRSGVDAEIIEEMERQRAPGRRPRPARYFSTSRVASSSLRTDRRVPALTVSRPGVADVEGVFLAIVQNSSPWTFLGPMPVDPCPRASFDTGLDLFAPRSLAVFHASATCGACSSRAAHAPTRSAGCSPCTTSPR